jgi:hypothetical protein
MKFLNFSLLLWVIFALLDPDPDSESGSVSTDPIEFGSGSATLLYSSVVDPDPVRFNPKLLAQDPDPKKIVTNPQHCFLPVYSSHSYLFYRYFLIYGII